MKLAHVINVTEITAQKQSSYLHIAQPTTLRSMLHARAGAPGDVAVELIAIKHRSEQVSLPEGFVRAPDIATYAWEHIEELRTVEPKRPLPRLVDIVAPGQHVTDAEFMIYTNLDIGLYPSFYAEVAALIRKGHDGFCINRRDLPKIVRGRLLDENALDAIYALKGSRHIGIDCFVFRRAIIPSLQLGNVFVGFPPVGQVLKTQIERHSIRFAWLKDRCLTFHLGSDLAWNVPNHPYYVANLREAEGLYVDCFGGSSFWARVEALKKRIGRRFHGKPRSP